MRGGLGCRAHDFGILPLDELAARVADKGFDCVQLAPAKAVKDFGGEGTKISPAFASRAASAFAARGVRIAVLGCYINPVHPDPALRRAALDRFKGYIAACADFGCGIVATETGSLNADSSAHAGNSGKEAFAILRAACAELAEAAEAAGVKVCIEGVVRHVAHSPARLAALLDAVPSPALAALLDPVNFLDAENLESRKGLIGGAFSLLGKRILALHAKDCVAEAGGLRIVPPGKGLLDWPAILALLEAANPAADILIEDLSPGEMEGARAFVARAAGIA